jgi:hypothetical protein
VKSKGKEEGTMIVQEPVAAKDVISTNEVDNRGMPKAVPIQHLSSILQHLSSILVEVPHLGDLLELDTNR